MRVSERLRIRGLKGRQFHVPINFNDLYKVFGRFFRQNKAAKASSIVSE